MLFEKVTTAQVNLIVFILHRSSYQRNIYPENTSFVKILCLALDFIFTDLNKNWLEDVFFFNIWLPHSQLWAIRKGTASLTQLYSQHLNYFDMKVMRSLVKKLYP